MRDVGIPPQGAGNLLKDATMVGRLKNCKICLLLIASSASVTRLCNYRAPVHWPTLPQDRSDEETRTCPRCIAA